MFFYQSIRGHSPKTVYHMLVFYRLVSNLELTIQHDQDQDLEMIVGSNLHATALTLRAQVASDFEELMRVLIKEFPNDISTLTLETYKWALSCVWVST
jgi:hypothetical protein